MAASRLQGFFRSTVGKKIVMAATGLVLVGFVVSHMAGNLKAFGGFDSAGVHKLDHYAEFLRSIGSDIFGHGGFLWVARAVLLACVGLHILMAVQLSARNMAAKPVQYHGQRFSSASTSSLSMRIGGALLMLFIICHILHFTTGTIAGPGFVHGKVYANVHAAFQNVFVSLGYVAAMFVLALHLSHGMWSALQTLGLAPAASIGALRGGAGAIGFLVALGFAAVPIAFYLGFLPAPGTH